MIDLTPARLRELLDYDPFTGVFTRKIDLLLPRGGIKIRAGTVAGSADGLGYLRIRVDTRKYKAHRLAFLYMTDQWPVHEVDHINGVRDDNRWSNLRDVTRSVNQQNQRGPTATNSTGLMGAHRRPYNFASQIQIDGKNVLLGSFKTKEEAHEAYITAKRAHHAGCTI